MPDTPDPDAPEVAAVPEPEYATDPPPAPIDPNTVVVDPDAEDEAEPKRRGDDD